MHTEQLAALISTSPETLLEGEHLDSLALIYTSDPRAFNALRQDLKSTGAVTMRLFDEQIQKRAQAAKKKPLRAVEEGERPQIQLVSDFIGDSPIDGLILPQGYILSDTETISFREKQVGNQFVWCRNTLAMSPVLITALTKDIDSDRQGVRLTWRAKGNWRHLFIDRGAIANGQTLIEHCAPYGFPVHSGNKNDLCEYLTAFAIVNEFNLSETKTSTHCGFQGPHTAPSGFFIGSRLILPDGQILPPSDFETAIDSQPVAFRPASDGQASIARAYRPHGSYETWKQAIYDNAMLPIPLFGLYASFVPPLLDILDVQNFVVDFAGTTTTGKTTTQRIAASVWGNPREDMKDSAIIGWDNTAVFIERNAAARSGLPLIINDTRTLRPEMRGEKLQSLLYNFSEGRGRGRGERGNSAIASTETWRSVLISSGEAKITALASGSGGVLMRCVAIAGKPFGPQRAKLDSVLKEFNADLCENYGHAGPEFVSWIFKNKEHWPTWKEHYREISRRLARSYQGERAGRLAGSVAAVWLAARLAHEAIQLPWDFDTYNPIPELWPMIAAESDDVTGADRILHLLSGWILRNEHTFKRADATDQPPANGWTGPHWIDTEGEVRIFPDRLERLLSDFGIEQPQAVIGEWFEAGLMKAPAGGKRGFKVQCRFEGERTQFYVFLAAQLWPSEEPNR